MAINLSKTEEQLTNEVMGKINLSKDKVNLEKHVVNLSKTIVNLSKKNNYDLTAVQARVVIVLDYSGSMDTLYMNGKVQKTLNRLVPLGLTFDDNGTIDMYLFSNDYEKLDDINIDNYSDYIKQVVPRTNIRMAGTSYAPVLRAIALPELTQERLSTYSVPRQGFFGKLFGPKEEHVIQTEVVKNNESIISDEQPTYVIFITDGDCGDGSKTDEVVRQISDKNLFVQFVGIGNASFRYLEKLDDLDSRVRDNTGFTKFKDIENETDDNVYMALLDEYGNWLKNNQ